MTTRIPSFSIVLALAFGCAAEDHEGLDRRPIETAERSGWARVHLDAGAQLAIDGAWIGAGAVPVPSVREQAIAPAVREVPVLDPLLGRDDRGQPTAEFRVAVPAGAAGEGEHLLVRLELVGTAPWTCAVAVERARGNVELTALDPPIVGHVYDLGASGSAREIEIPWDGERYRLTLRPLAGESPRIAAVTARARRPHDAGPPDQIVPVVLGEPRDQGGRVVRTAKLPGTLRVTTLELAAAAPTAPVAVEIGTGEPSERGAPAIGSGAVWNLPALGDRKATIAVTPTATDALWIATEPGVRFDSAEVHVRTESLWFPAEAGTAYFLHTGGRLPEIPGSLTALPAGDALHAVARLELGPPEPDPDGLPRIRSGAERSRPWLPLGVGILVVCFAAIGFRLLRPEPRGG